MQSRAARFCFAFKLLKVRIQKHAFWGSFYVNQLRIFNLGCHKIRSGRDCRSVLAVLGIWFRDLEELFRGNNSYVGVVSRKVFGVSRDQIFCPWFNGTCEYSDVVVFLKCVNRLLWLDQFSGIKQIIDMSLDGSIRKTVFFRMRSERRGCCTSEWMNCDRYNV